jgi:hypothetical protein
VEEMTKIERDGGGAKNNEVGKMTRLTGDEVVSMNMWGFTPAVFAQLRNHFQGFLELNGVDVKSESFIPSTVNDLVVARQARVKVLRTNDSWFGVTYREDRPRVAESIGQLIARSDYPERLWT